MLKTEMTQPTEHAVVAKTEAPKPVALKARKPKSPPTKPRGGSFGAFFAAVP